MNEQKANAKTVTRLMLRLLPIQVLLAAVGSVNGIVSSFFASNFVGVAAMRWMIHGIRFNSRNMWQ